MSHHELLRLNSGTVIRELLTELCVLYSNQQNQFIQCNSAAIHSVRRGEISVRRSKGIVSEVGRGALLEPVQVCLHFMQSDRVCTLKAYLINMEARGGSCGVKSNEIPLVRDCCVQQQFQPLIGALEVLVWRGD